MNPHSQCPFLKEVAMLYCDACPTKKLLRRDQVVSMGPCATSDFASCPLARDLLSGASDSDEEARRHAHEGPAEVHS